MGLRRGCCQGGRRVSDGNLQFPKRKTREVSDQWRKHRRWVIRQKARKRQEDEQSSVSSLSEPTLLNKTIWQYLCTWFHISSSTDSLNHRKKYLRHRNDHEIQPVPWISKECKPVYTEASRADFYKRLKCINSRECVPARKKALTESVHQLDQGSLTSKCLHPY